MQLIRCRFVIKAHLLLDELFHLASNFRWSTRTIWNAECDKNQKIDLQIQKIDLRLTKIDRRVPKIDLRVAKIDRRVPKIDCRASKIGSSCFQNR